MSCDCDLRHRRWNPNTGRCETCKAAIPRPPSREQALADAMHTFVGPGYVPTAPEQRDPAVMQLVADILDGCPRPGGDFAKYEYAVRRAVDATLKLAAERVRERQADLERIVETIGQDYERDGATQFAAAAAYILERVRARGQEGS